MPEHRLTVIRNSARLAAFEHHDPGARGRLLDFFPEGDRVSSVVLAAGRLSPEKGFSVLIDAAASFLRSNRTVGVVLFGEGALRPELDRRRIAVAWEESEKIPAIELDRNQIEQVLVNVLKNAMESIGEDGAIVFHLGFEGSSKGSWDRGRPFLSIKDSGPGIPEEVRALLFTPFFSTKRNGRGLGLTDSRHLRAQSLFAGRPWLAGRGAWTDRWHRFASGLRGLSPRPRRSGPAGIVPSPG